MSLFIDRARARQIVVLAAPIVIAMLTQTFINVVDTLFVGKLDPSLSIPGQAALGFSLPLLWAFGGSVSAIGVGTQVITARRFGSGDDRASGAVLGNAVVVSILASLLMSLLAWIVIPDLFAFLTSNPSVQDAGIPYARIRILGIVSMVLTTAYKGFFDGVGRTKVHMYAALIMNAANIALNYVLIFGLGPIAPMHVEGAAIASLISTFIGLGVMIGWTFKKKYRHFKPYHPTNFSPHTMWELVRLSAPGGLAQIFIMSGVLMFLKIIAGLDVAAVKAVLAQSPFYTQDALPALDALYTGLRKAPEVANHALLGDWASTLLWSRPPLFTTAAKLIIDLMSIGFVTCIAFGTATATLVSQAMGRGDFQEASAVGWDSVRIGIYLYGAIGLVIILFPAPFLDFLSDDPQVIAAAIPGLRIMASLEMFTAMALILTQALFGAGDTKYVMIVEFLLHGLCLAPLAYLFSVVFDFGFLGIWFSATLYLILLALAMALKFWGGSWTKIKV